MNHKKFVFTLLSAAIISAAYPLNVFAEKAASTHSADTKSTMQQHQKKLSGKLLETQDAGGYTYVKISSGKDSVWAAGPITSVKLGDQIAFNARMPMLNFKSKSLGREFNTIYFVDHFTVNGKNTKKANIQDPHKSAGKSNPTKQLKSFSKIEGGQTIDEVLKNKTANTHVKIRGQVSKFTAGVMGKNWIHIRDSSSTQDITVTTDASVALDDIISIEGTLAFNKDFGYGYVYDVIIEDAKVTAEN